MGGHIMSHDMVEAALLRRRGWGVHMANLPTGSHEEFPPTLTDLAVRDRRWCQGNLQHLRLLRGSGFHWVNRLQQLMGASAYMTSPLWLILVLFGVLQPLGLFVDNPALHPSGWPLTLPIVFLFWRVSAVSGCREACPISACFASRYFSGLTGCTC